MRVGEVGEVTGYLGGHSEVSLDSRLISVTGLKARVEGRVKAGSF